MGSTADNDMRELDRRQGDGLDVALLWEPATDCLYVVLTDVRMRESFRIRVEAGNAVDAFEHPFAYASRRPGTERTSGTRAGSSR
jgi:hypothetical protein